MNSYRDGSFTSLSSEMGPIMPYPVTVPNWSPGMGDMPPAVPYPVMPLPRVVYQWTPGMGEMTAQETAAAITASITGAAGSIFAADAARRAVQAEAKYQAKVADANARIAAARSQQTQQFVGTLTTGLIAASVIAGLVVLTGGYRSAKRRRP